MELYSKFKIQNSKLYKNLPLLTDSEREIFYCVDA